MIGKVIMNVVVVLKPKNTIKADVSDMRMPQMAKWSYYTSNGQKLRFIEHLKSQCK